MISDFRERISNFQQHGERLVIDEILYGATFDFKNDPSRKHTQLSQTVLKVTIDLPRHEYYISYRIRVLRDFALKDIRGERLDAHSREFSRILSIIRIDHQIDFDGEVIEEDPWCYFYKMTPQLIANLKALQPEIEGNLHYEEYKRFVYYLNKYEQQTYDTAETAGQAEAQIDANILTALERALSYVDTTKSEREIVSYVNQAFATRFGEIELARKGMKRIYRTNNSGDKVSLHVTKKFPKDDYSAILTELSTDNIDKLTGDYREFIEKIRRLVLVDRQSGDFTNYNLTTRGFAIIQRAYIAEKLGIPSATVRKRLSRIKKNVTL